MEKANGMTSFILFPNMNTEDCEREGQRAGKKWGRAKGSRRYGREKMRKRVGRVREWEKGKLKAKKGGIGVASKEDKIPGR